MYVSPNYRTKKAIKEALALGASVWVYQPNALNMDHNVQDGEVFLEGPHYPDPHRWYGRGEVKMGKLVNIK
jgi:hypothetical protein